MEEKEVYQKMDLFCEFILIELNKRYKSYNVLAFNNIDPTKESDLLVFSVAKILAYATQQKIYYCSNIFKYLRFRLKTGIRAAWMPTFKAKKNQLISDSSMDILTNPMKAAEVDTTYISKTYQNYYKKERRK